jgi:Nuclease-related domain
MGPGVSARIVRVNRRLRDMAARFDLPVQARRRTRSGRSGVAGAVLAASLAAVAVVVAGILVLVFNGHGISWVAGLIAGAAAAAWATVGWGRSGAGFRTSGTRAERRTELAVASLEQSGWRFLHHVSGPDGIYDHIAVGPGGLILLESLSPGGLVRMNAGEPFVERREDPQAPPRLERLRPTALADATTLRDSVQRIAERRMWVQSVVVFWSDFPAGCVADGRCVYIHGSRLAAWMTRRPHQFDEHQADEVLAAVRELAEHGGDMGLPVAV